MQNNGKQTTDEKLDQALEDTFPSSDPVSISRPETRQGTPKQHSQTAAQSVRDTANVIKNKAEKKIGHRIEPDYFWLGGAFILGCLVGIAARSAPSLARSPGYGEQLLEHGSRLQRKLSRKASDLHLQRKLSELLERLQ